MAENNIHVGIVCDLILIDWSGVEYLFSKMAAELLRRGHYVTIIAQRPKGKVSPKIPLAPIPSGCDVIQCDYDSREGLDAARAAICSAGLDVIVSQCAKKEFMRTPWLLKGSGIPFIDAECVHPRVLTYERWNPYEHYATLEVCDCVTVPLEAYRAFYPQYMRERIAVVGYPAAPTQEVDFAAREGKARRTLLALGRMDEADKQYSLLLRAWQILYPEFPDWSLQLVGSGKDLPLYQAMADALGKDARITMPGSVSNVGDYYRGADIFCMPSRQEGLPHVLGEAAAYGLPIVAYASCDAAKAVISPEIGMLAEPTHPAALAEVLRTMMSSAPECRTRMGRNAQEFFAREYGADICQYKYRLRI